MKKISKDYIIKKVERTFQRNANARLVVALVIIFAGYAFFFNTKTIFVKNDITIEETPLAETIEFDKRTFKLIRWDYAKTEDKCEVELDVLNEAYDGNDNYIYEAYARAKDVEKKLKVSPVINESTSVILQIENIPEDFAEMVLRISMPEDEDKIVKLYATKASVVQIDSLPIKTREEYSKVRLRVEKDSTEAQIREHKEEIEVINNSIKACDDQIVGLKGQLEYQSETTRKETQQQIERAISQKEEYLRSIDKINDKILLLEEDVVQLETKIGGGQNE